MSCICKIIFATQNYLYDLTLMVLLLSDPKMTAQYVSLVNCIRVKDSRVLTAKYAGSVSRFYVINIDFFMFSHCIPSIDSRINITWRIRN